MTTDHAVQYHADLARYMSDNGWDVTFISSGGDSLDSLGEDVAVEHIPMERNPSPLKDLGSLFKWIRVLYRIRPDIVISGTPKAGLLGMMSSRLLRVPNRIYWLHGLRLETASGKMRTLLELIERFVIASATTTVAVSPSLRNLVLSMGLAKESDISVIGSGSTQGVDTLRFAPTNDDAERAAEKARWGLDPNLLTIGFVGRLTKDKGIEELCEASVSLLEKASNFQVFLVGPLEDAAGERVIAEMEARGVPFVAPGKIDDTSAAFKAMDIFCLPSYREGLPNVVLEAFASGLPVVATSVTGNTDLIDPGENGLLVEARDSEALRGALDAVIRDPNLRTELGSRALVTARSEFDVQHVISEQLRFLKAVSSRANESTH
ncbi:glycosyltransferase family 4 protein [Corynebacterium wankanglinii]|nr:glycosyltransferase family 4 protein [Corynebacterium wankanglinii]